MAGKTTLVISHHMPTLRGADKVVTLDAAGRVVADGAADLPKRRPRLGPAASDPGGCQVKAASRAPHTAGPLASLARNIHWHIFGHTAVERRFAQDV